MNKILAIDTATHACSAALYIDGWVDEQYKYAPRMHGELILNMVDELLTNHGLTLANLDALAYGAGPGSFTGVRLATSTIQGLSFGAQKPVIPISSLLAQADAFYKYLGYSQIACAFDARMGEVYWGVYQFSAGEWEAVVPDCVIAPDKVSVPAAGEWVGVGDGWGSYAKKLSEITGVKQSYPRFYPHAASIAKLAAKEFAQKHFIQLPAEILPVYLRNDVVK